MAQILFVDNKDSFTYNLVDELEKLDHKVTVYRNTVKSSQILEKLNQLIENNEPALLFFSPGPGKPSDSVCMDELLTAIKGKVPILGVCLGHQAIVEHFGGKVGLAGETVHGKASIIKCNSHPVFEGLNLDLTVARYHSLVATDIPNNLTVIGHYKEMPMAIIEEDLKILGFQFHPESVLTTNGSKLLEQSINHLLKDSGQ